MAGSWPSAIWAKKTLIAGLSFMASPWLIPSTPSGISTNRKSPNPKIAGFGPVVFNDPGNGGKNILGRSANPRFFPRRFITPKPKSLVSLRYLIRHTPFRGVISSNLTSIIHLAISHSSFPLDTVTYLFKQPYKKNLCFLTHFSIIYQQFCNHYPFEGIVYEYPVFLFPFSFSRCLHNAARSTYISSRSTPSAHTNRAPSQCSKRRLLSQGLSPLSLCHYITKNPTVHDRGGGHGTSSHRARAIAISTSSSQNESNHRS